MSSTDRPFRDRVTHKLPSHLANWQLPPDWSWGNEGVQGEHRHYQEIVDALGRSLSLVSAPDPAHHDVARTRRRGISRIATTRRSRRRTTTGRAPRRLQRGPGYLRRWIAGETLGRASPRIGHGRRRRSGSSSCARPARRSRYLHSGGGVTARFSAETCWTTPMGRLWLLGWQWAVRGPEIPAGLDARIRASCPCRPSGRRRVDAHPRERSVAARGHLLRRAHAASIRRERRAAAHARAPGLSVSRGQGDRPRAESRARSIASTPSPPCSASSTAWWAAARRMFTSGAMAAMRGPGESEEARLRWATGDDYEVIGRLGSGSFGSVWRVRDLSLGREVALKLLHPQVARDERRGRAASAARRSSPRSSRIRPSSRSTTGTRAATSPGTRWSSPRAARSPISSRARARARSPRSRRRSTSCSTGSRRRTRSASSIAISSRRTC